MTLRAFFEKYRRVVIPFQLRLHERAFGISNEDISGHKAAAADPFVLKRHTDQEGIRALSATFSNTTRTKSFRTC
jgi:hypothetical protein